MLSYSTVFLCSTLILTPGNDVSKVKHNLKVQRRLWTLFAEPPSLLSAGEFISYFTKRKETSSCQTYRPTQFSLHAVLLVPLLKAWNLSILDMASGGLWDMSPFGEYERIYPENKTNTMKLVNRDWKILASSMTVLSILSSKFWSVLNQRFHSCAYGLKWQKSVLLNLFDSSCFFCFMYIPTLSTFWKNGKFKETWKWLQEDSSPSLLSPCCVAVCEMGAPAKSPILDRMGDFLSTPMILKRLKFYFSRLPNAFKTKAHAHFVYFEYLIPYIFSDSLIWNT